MMSDTPEKPPEKDKQAVALNYDGITAPTLTAKGCDDIAEEIIAIAKENDIPIREEPELVKLLASLKLGDEIPRELYVAVAEIISFVYMLKGKVPQSRSS